MSFGAGAAWDRLQREVGWRAGAQFEVTERHLRLLRNTYVRWDYVEFGAPAIDSKRPYGNSDVYGDMVELVFAEEARAAHPHLDEQEAYQEYANARRPELDRLHAESGLALQIALTTGEFRAGHYVLGAGIGWRWTEEER